MKLRLLWRCAQGLGHIEEKEAHLALATMQEAKCDFYLFIFFLKWELSISEH